MSRRKSRRSFSKEFKLQVICDVDAGVSIAEAARIHDVRPETVRLRRRNERKFGERAFAGNGRAYTDEAKIAQLGQVTLENALFVRYADG
jgi:transposase-like protein